MWRWNQAIYDAALAGICASRCVPCPPARPHPTVSTRRFDRRRLQITPQPAGDRVLVRFRLPLLLLVAVTVNGVGRRLGRADETNALMVLLTAEG